MKITPYQTQAEETPCEAQKLNEAALRAASESDYARALEISDDVIGRFGDSQERVVRGQVARAYSNKIALLSQSGLLDEAVAAAETAMRQFERDSDPDTRYRVTNILTNKASALSRAKRYREVVEVADELKNWLDGSEPEAAQPLAATLLTDKVLWLVEDGREAEAVEAADNVSRLFAAWDANAEVHHQICKATLLKVYALAQGDQPQRARTVWEEAVERFGQDEDGGIQTLFKEMRAHLGEDFFDTTGAQPSPNDEAAKVPAQPIETLFYRAQMFGKAGMHADAIAANEELLRVYFDLEVLTAEQRLLAWQAMLCQAAGYEAMERTKKAIEVYGALSDRFAAGSFGPIAPEEKSALATALFERAALYQQRDKPKKAVACYDELLENHVDASGLEERLLIAQAGVNRADALFAQGKRRKAEASFLETLEKFRAADEDELRVWAAQAARRRGLCLLESGEIEAALEASRQTVEEFGDDSASEVRRRVVLSMMDMVTAHAVIEDLDGVLQMAENALETFGGEEESLGVAMAVNWTISRAVNAVDEAISVEALENADTDKNAATLLESFREGVGERTFALMNAAKSRLWSVRTAIDSKDFSLSLQIGLVRSSLLEKMHESTLVIENFDQLWVAASFNDEAEIRAGGPRSQGRELIAEKARIYAMALHQLEEEEESERLYLQITNWFAGTDDADLQVVRIGTLAGYAQLLQSQGRYAAALERLDEWSKVWPANARASRPWPEEDYAQTQELRGQIEHQLRKNGGAYASEISSPQTAAASEPRRFTVRNVPQLVQALEEAEDRDIISLQRGTYRLNFPLYIAKSVCLGGAGAGETVIACSHPEGVLRLVEHNEWVVQNIEFRHEYPRELLTPFSSAVVRVSGGDFKVRRCTFRGGRRGLLADAEARVIARGCIFTGNTESGVTVTSYASAVLEANRIYDNGILGIHFSDHANGVARNNECFDHHYGNIVLGDHAAAQLENNTLYRANFGIAYGHDSGGVAAGNLCATNFAGIGVEDDATPTLENNRCLSNYHYGIVYNGRGAGAATGNECLGNGSSESPYGPSENIRVFPHGAPTLAENETGDLTEADAAEADHWNEEFGARQQDQIMQMTALMLQLDMDALVPGMPKSGLYENGKETIFDDELFMAFIFQLHSPAPDDEFALRLLPQWTEIYRRIIAEGRRYM